MSSKKLAKKNAAARVSPSGRDATSRVEETLNKVEDLVVNSSHLPLTGKSMIDENDLIHLVEELRQDLPLELNHARELMEKETEIIEQAHREADEIIQKAKDYAAGLVAKETVVTEAQAKKLLYEADVTTYVTYQEGQPLVHLMFWLWQEDEGPFTEKDGQYWVTINLQTEVIEDILYDAGLAGNG